MAAMGSLIKALCLLVAALLFLIGAFVDDPTTVWSLGLMLVALGLVVEELPTARSQASTMSSNRP